MTQSIHLPSFDELAALAKDNPEKLTQLRQQLCDQYIDTCSEAMQTRLTAQQSHIERVLQKAKNPIHANVLLRDELHRQIVKFSKALNGEQLEPSTGATILPFGRKEEWR
ncbi:DUF3135 domain-containing protein [Vibrio hippocampi]|uniref:DUF3135 domain-containing protein n=1 Tax=Vibrio hippocampi TaxID=654686 RepID=A0ABN8DF75_9VIBR|nr:DUF3135 domain-containing protein [Vibrio hippocampi]CAH0524430.1 hypothetical protein VHP8226_00257 [Vibrio hippocampi]